MPVYRYECDNCGASQAVDCPIELRDAPTRVGHRCDGDVKAGKWKRVFGFHFGRSMPEHYSHTLDTYISNAREHGDTLKRQSDEMSARMGFDVNYEPVDPSDAAAAGVKGDDGLESQERQHFDDTFDGHRDIFT